MPQILTITLNPALDLSTAADAVIAGPKLRCAVPRFDPGGGGINVSRAIRGLGGDSLAFAALGGATGAKLADLLTEQGINIRPFAISGETRQSLAVTDRSTGGQYRFVMPGPDWTEAMTKAALADIVKASTSEGLVVLSGSLPPGVAADFPVRLVAGLSGTGTRVVADISGAGLRHLAEHPCGIDILRMDAAEAAELAGRPLDERSETTAFARDLVVRNVAQVVIVARGADGSTLVSGDQALHCSRAVETVVSAVGAGDSFVGALTLALANGSDLANALRHGTAAASAAMLTEATELCTRADAELMFNECELTVL